MKSYDLNNGWLTKEGSVDSISIAGNSSFTNTDSFYYNAEVIILVHTFTRTGCEDIALSEFDSFIKLSCGGSITPVYGEEFEMLKATIRSKNPIPEYLENSMAREMSEE